MPYPDSDPYTVHKPVSAASSKHAEIASVKVASVRATAGGGEGTGGGDGGEGGGEGGEAAAAASAAPVAPAGLLNRCEQPRKLDALIRSCWAPALAQPAARAAMNLNRSLAEVVSRLDVLRRQGRPLFSRSFSEDGGGAG